jgi:hypothetical protein
MGVPFDQLRFGHFTDKWRTEIFRRAPDGSWWIISPGFYGWTYLGGSSFPLTDLRFGSFNGDGLTDVLAVEAGSWAISKHGRETWKPLNRLSDNVSSLMIGDLRGVGTDDVIRYVRKSWFEGRWEVSWGGRTPWTHLAKMTWPAPTSTPTTPEMAVPSAFVWNLIGRFTGTNAAQVLMVDRSPDPHWDRRGQILDIDNHEFHDYSQYAY